MRGPPVKQLCASLLALAIGVLLSTPAPARPPDDIAAAEALARTRYLEGIPYREARRLSAGGATRLVEMLEDPAEARHHAQIVEVLGMSERAGAYEAIARAAAAAPHGEVDGATLRTRVAVRVALGHLARSDDRALADLVAAATAEDPAPAWSHRHLRGTRLAALLRRSALTGLALSGRPQAAEALQRLRLDAPGGRARAATGATEFARHLESALRLHGRVASEGPDAVLHGDAFGGGPR